MKTWLSLALCLSIGYGLYGQDNLLILDKVRLKNGSIFLGQILRLDYGEVIEFRNTSGVVFTIPYGAVKKISHEAVNRSGIRPEYMFMDQKFYSVGEIELISGDQRTEDTPGIGIKGVFGYRIHRLVGLGVGLSLHHYYPGKQELIYASSAEMRGFLWPRRTSLYYTLSAGWGFPGRQTERSDSRSGFYWAPSLGYRFGAKDGANMTLGLGYNFQRIRYITDLGNQTSVEQNIHYRRLNIKLGFII